MGRRPFFWVLLAVVIVLGGALAAVAGLGTGSRIAPKRYTVVFSVTGSGTSTITGITYSAIEESNGQHRIARVHDAPLPWTQSITVSDPNTVFTMNAVNGPVGLSYVVCAITKDGRVLSTNRANGPYAFASCEAIGSATPPANATTSMAAAARKRTAPTTTTTAAPPPAPTTTRPTAAPSTTVPTVPRTTVAAGPGIGATQSTPDGTSVQLLAFGPDPGNGAVTPNPGTTLESATVQGCAPANGTASFDPSSFTLTLQDGTMAAAALGEIDGQIDPTEQSSGSCVVGKVGFEVPAGGVPATLTFQVPQTTDSLQWSVG